MAECDLHRSCGTMSASGPQSRGQGNHAVKKSRLRDGAAFTVVWIPYALFTWQFRWLCDDAFISFRYARNWIDGLGLRFNPGSSPPVEGYSNYLWMAFCALIEFLGLDITFWPRLVSFLCGSILLYLVFWKLRTRLELGRLPSVLAAATLGCAPPYFIWSTSGLETMPYALLLFVTFQRLLLRRTGPACVSGGIAGLGLALIRVEGIAWALFIGVLAYLKRPSASQSRTLNVSGGQTERSVARPVKADEAAEVHSSSSATSRPDEHAATNATRALLPYFSIVLIGFAIHYACRHAYYGEPLPNTAYAKMGLSDASIIRGIKYVLAYFLVMISPVVAIAGMIIGLRSAYRSIMAPVAGIALASLAYGVLTGGDFMTFWRFLVPGFVVFSTLLVGVLLKVMWHRGAVTKIAGSALAAVMIVLTVLPAYDVHLLPRSILESAHFRGSWEYRTERDMWEHMDRNTREWIATGITLSEYAEPGDTCVLTGIGAIGYYSDLFIYDQAGLVTPAVARRPVTAPNTTPGHDKLVPASFFLNKQPDIFYVVAHPQEPEGVLTVAAYLSRLPVKQEYVIDLVPVATGAGLDSNKYIILMRRIESGVDPRTAWSNAIERVNKLAQWHDVSGNVG